MTNRVSRFVVGGEVHIRYDSGFRFCYIPTQYELCNKKLVFKWCREENVVTFWLKMYRGQKNFHGFVEMKGIS